MGLCDFVADVGYLCHLLFVHLFSVELGLRQLETDGCLAGGYSSLWGRFAMSVASNHPGANSMVGLFATARGIGNIVGGPIACVFLLLRLSR